MPTPDDHIEMREPLRGLCRGYIDECFRKIEAEHGYPEAFACALTDAGWLAVMPLHGYGGSGLGLAEASVAMEEVNRCGGNASVCHGQMDNMGTLLGHGSEVHKKSYQPKIAGGEWRPQSMAVAESTTGADTAKLKTKPVKKGDPFVANGQKVWVSRLRRTELMILPAPTTPIGLIGEEVKGFKHLLEVLNVELMLWAFGSAATRAGDPWGYRREGAHSKQPHSCTPRW